MIDTSTIAEIKDFFDKLPRPLPKGLKLNAAETVTDPEIFVETMLILLQHRKDTAYADDVLARLLTWKKLYLEASVT